MKTYEFTDKLGKHIHLRHTGPYDFHMKIECPACLDRLAAQRLELCQKYGWSTWPFVVKEGR
jgi:hypothetical protein